MILNAINLNAVLPFWIMDEWACPARARIDNNGNFPPIPLFHIEHVTFRLQFLRDIIDNILLIHVETYTHIKIQKYEKHMRSSR